jgi:hypothetical protein
MILLFPILLSWLIQVQARTHATTLDAKLNGEFLLLKAAFEGDLKSLQSAILQQPNLDCILTQEIGERYLKLGKVGIDFPIAPPLHLAISGGTTHHLRVAHRLVLAGADVNYFNFTTLYRFPPPIYFALGAFSFPTPAHAGLLSALFRTYAESFHYASIPAWVRISGYPPPLHTCTFFNNIDGIYVLSSLPNYNMDERDNESLSALHVAAWLGNFVHVSFLLQQGADPLARDSYNRTFLHYCAIRGIATIPINILNKPSPISPTMKKALVEIKDHDNNTALDIARLLPSQDSFVGAMGAFSDLQSAQGTQSTQESSENWEKILTLNAAELTPSYFWRYFQITQRPVMITGNFTSVLPIWAIISSRAGFIQRFGSLVLNVTYSDTLDSSQALPNKELVEGFLRRGLFWNTSVDVSPSCLSAWHLAVAVTHAIPPNLLGDLTSPSLDNFFEACLNSSSVELRIYSGNTTTGVSLRSHSAAWNVLLLGATRTWHFLSPGTTLDLMISLASNETNKIPMGLDREDPLQPQLSPREWGNQVLPFLRKNKLVSSIRQGLGDVIYIPHGWSYVIIGSNDVIEMTTQICESSSQSLFDQVPIGHRLYGKSKNRLN